MKFGLCFFLLPLGMCFWSAFWMIVLNVCTAVLMFVMGVLLSVVKCCSVSSVKASQLALLKLVYVRLWPAGVCLVLVVMMIGRWSDPSLLTTLQDVVGARLGEQKVMSGDDVW